MKKLILLLSLLASPAYAGVTCSLPFNLQNGNVADATQVMANYNALTACLANAAAAGVNNDITALTALSTPLTPSQGGTPVYIGGTSTGPANAQVVGVVSPSSFALTAGNQVTFYVGAPNTGPTTLNVALTGATNIYRRTQLGISAMVGGELVAGHAATVEFDGTQFQLVSSSPVEVGGGKEWFGATAPAGWAFIDGSCQLRVGIFADLYSVIGTTYDPTGSTCDVNHFALPDGRGRMLAGKDNMGGSAANRITTAGSSCDGTILGGAGCGFQNQTLTVVQMPSHSHGITDPSHFHAATFALQSGTAASGAGAGAAANFATNTAAAVTGISINNTGGDNPHPILNPIQIVNKIIKY